MKHPRVLVVDDDPDIRRLVSAYLRRDGMEVITAEDGETALMHEATQQPDLVVLDLMLPGIGGIDVLRAIRERGTRPVVLLTARDEVTDRVLGLELGADDYVTKPFHPRELVARVHTILRRAQERSQPPRSCALANWTSTSTGAKYVSDGALLPLTRTEFDLLAALVTSADGRVLSRADLLGAVASPDSITLERSIDSHIRNLRRKVEIGPGRAALHRDRYRGRLPAGRRINMRLSLRLVLAFVTVATVAVGTAALVVGTDDDQPVRAIRDGGAPE